MPYSIVIPRLGLTMETGRVVQWYKRSGETVALGEPLFSVESDKAVQDIEALAAGAVYPLPNLPDEPLPIATVIGYILAPGEALPAGVAAASAPVAAATSAVVVAPVAAAPAAAAPQAPAAVPTADASAPTRKFSSPAARRRAKELALDWHTVERPGGGPILLAHVERAAASAQPAAPAIQISPAVRPAERSAVSLALVDTWTVEADATLLVSLHEQLRTALAARKQAAPTYAGLFARLAAFAVSNLDETQLLFGAGLPIIDVGEQGADSASLSLDPAQSALLAVGRIVKRPAEWQGQLVLRQRVTLSLTFDRGVLSRQAAGRLLDAIRALVEQPYLLLAA